MDVQKDISVGGRDFAVMLVLSFLQIMGLLPDA